MSLKISSELRALIAGVALNGDDDTPRRVLADWLDEHYPATPVKLHGVPKGLYRWWSVSGNAQRHNDNRYGRGPWAGWAIIQFLRTRSMASDPVNWLDHCGSTVIDGESVLVGEPYAKEESALVESRRLQKWLHCPVGIARRAAWHDDCIRIIIWFGLFELMPTRWPVPLAMSEL